VILSSWRTFSALLAAFIILGVSTSSSAFTISGQNEARYGRGKKFNGIDYRPVFYFENYLELSASHDHFRFYLRQAYREPGEYELQTSGIQALDKLFVEYQTDDYTLRGGDFYRIWGKGILFGNQEVRDLNLDGGLKGLLGEVHYGAFEGAIMRGVESDTISTPRESAEGIYLSQRLPWDLRLGGAYFHFDAGSRHPEFERHGFEIEKGFPLGSLYAVYASDRFPGDWWAIWPTYDPTLPGRFHRFYHALFSTASVYGDGWSLYFDYRHYRLFNFYDVKPVVGQVWANNLQFPPIGRPENTFHLMDSYPRSIRYYNDVGYQLELTANQWGWDYLLNYSLSSETDSSGGIFATMKEAYSPSHGLFVKAEHEFSESFSLGIQAAAQRDVANNYGLLDKSKRLGGGIDLENNFEGLFSLQSQVQVMSVMNIDGSYLPYNYYEEYLGTTVAGDNVSLTVGLMRSEAPKLVEGALWPKGIIGGEARFWPMGELVLQIWDVHRLDLFYGFERGGISCAGGICRNVPPFKGVKLTLTSHF